MVLLCFFETLLFLLKLEETLGLRMEHKDLLLYLTIGLHESVEYGHEVAREDGLLVVYHLRDQLGLFLAEFT